MSTDRRALIVLALCGVGLVPLVAAAQTNTFEGVVTYEVPNGDDQPATMTYLVKGNNVRVDLTAEGAGSVIYNTRTGVVIAVNHAMHAYMKLDPHSVNASQLGAGLGPIAGALAGGGKDLAKTGHKETVAGVGCDDYAFVSDTVSIEACSAPGMTAFPLKITTTSGGETGFSATATRVEAKTLAPELFTVPPGYQELTGESLEGLMGGGKTPSMPADADDAIVQ